MKHKKIDLKDIDKVIPIGEKIMVYVNEGNFKGTYSSYIYDIDDDTIHILMPTNENGLNAVLRRRDSINVSFVAKNGDRLGFHSNIADIVENGKKKIYRIEKPTAINKIELRNNFRIEILIKAEYYYFRDGKIQKGEGTLIDISAGGAKISVEDEFEIKEKLFLQFVLDGYLLNGIEALVVRVAFRSEDVRHYGLMFTNLDKDKENRIIKYCINKQMEMIRKMKGID